MKRIIFILTAVFAVTGAIAQDTIRTCLPFDNYLYNYWHNFKEGDSVICNSSVCYPFLASMGIVMYNYDTLPIYGVAVGVDLNPAPDRSFYDSERGWYMVPGDTSLDESYIHFLFMQVDGDSVYEASDSLLLHMKFARVSYYIDDGFVSLYSHSPRGEPCPIFPVYELYFDSAITVYDTFYLIGRNHSDECDEEERNLYPNIWVAGRSYTNTVQRYVVVRWPPFVPPFPAPWIIDDGWQEHEGRAWQWLFPILTPNPDTNNYVPDDSTQSAIRIEAWERYVSVQPNPATDKVTVLSSIGLTQVEVFDITGNRMLMHEASGLSAKLDVGTLPRGTYIVRVQTPIGTTARKLLLQ